MSDKPKTITVNAREYITAADTWTHKDICALCDLPEDATITYRRARTPSGTLLRGQYITLCDGLIIDAVLTNNA